MTGDPITIGDAPLDETIAILSELPPMDLPSGAVLNADGSVTLTLDYPVAPKFRMAGSDAVVREEPVTQLVLKRLGGADVRKMIAAKNATNMALAISSGLGLGKLNLLLQVMDATDEAAAGDVVGELLGGLKAGLPANATDGPEGVLLPFSFPVTGEDGTHYASLFFKRLTAAQRRQAVDAANLLDWGVGIAAGVSPKDAKALVDAMDGADAMAVNQVILFLCGSGRRTSR